MEGRCVLEVLQEEEQCFSTYLREGLAAEATGKAVVLVVSANVSVHVSFLGLGKKFAKRTC